MNNIELLKLALDLADLALLDIGTCMIVNEDNSVDIHMDPHRGGAFLELLQTTAEKFVAEGKLQMVYSPEKEGYYRVRGIKALKADLMSRAGAHLSNTDEEPPTAEFRMGLN